VASRKPRSKKGAATREHVYRIALTLLRKRGYEQTTMRAIADAAELSLGAAYHYFPSKDAIVMAYYEETQAMQEAAVRAALETAPASFASRLETVFQTMIDVSNKERRLLGVLFAAVADPHHPLSPFSTKTTRIRERNFALFEELLANEPKPERRFLARQLWLVHLGLLLCVLYDASPERAETRKLATDVAAGIARLWPMLRSPLARPYLARIDRVFGIS